MALLSETATGLVFGMNVPDTHIPVIKSMKATSRSSSLIA
jgi:hypothetical protein